MMDMIKYTGVYDSNNVRDKTIALVGVGAVGSALALELVKLNIPTLDIVDPDQIEAHNISNQLLYGPDDIGENKVAVAARRLQQLGETKVYPHYGAYEGGTVPYQVILCCVDTMKVRKQMFNEGAVLNGVTKLWIDVRLTARQAQVYALDPSNTRHVEAYQKTLYSDDEVAPEEGGCGTTLSIGPTAHMATSLAAWLFIDWTNNDLKFNEVIWQQKGYHMITSRF